MLRMRARLAGFIEPCLPSPADRPPSGANWIHEIKHDGYRLMARRDPVGIRLITRRGTASRSWSRPGTTSRCGPA
jgi:bifunctional non-homologous end joining protein LigD